MIATNLYAHIGGIGYVPDCYEVREESKNHGQFLREEGSSFDEKIRGAILHLKAQYDRDVEAERITVDFPFDRYAAEWNYRNFGCDPTLEESLRSHFGPRMREGRKKDALYKRFVHNFGWRRK